MLEMILFHHHSSIYNKDWSKPGIGRVCSNHCYTYYSDERDVGVQLVIYTTLMKEMLMSSLLYILL